jgi:hypothetical protein
MARLITIVLVLAAIAGGAYVFLFKKDDASRTLKGYRKADTPQVAADMLKKAIESREYDMAAFYCTKDFAEQLRRGAKAANELADHLDRCTYQMKERGLIRDEVKAVFFALDPFPKEVQISVGKESGDTAEATLVFTLPVFSGNQPSSGTWNLRPEIMNVFVRSMQFKNNTTVVVKMKKEGEEWKFDFPVDSALQLRVGYLNDKYKNYTNPLEMVTQEVKNDATTRENVTSRLKSLLEQAAKE